jgi:hypothetical protein
MRPESPASLSPDTSKIEPSSSKTDPTLEQLQYQLTSINLSTLPLFESFPTIEQPATAKTHSMPIAWGDAVANRVREYNGTNSVTSFIRQIKAAFRSVGINPPTPIQ